jgi:hypothetical protein
MAKERIEKTLIILDENEVRQILQAARGNNPEETLHLLSQLIAKKVEAALRQRCR